MTDTSRLGRVGVMLPRDLPVGQILDFAVRAEELGFDELWTVEDLGYRGGIAQTAAVLGVTSRIHVGIGILPAAVRNVAFAAMEVATLEQLHPGRITVGLGHGMPGWMKQVDVWPASPLTLLREYTEALRALLRGHTAAAGTYVRTADLTLEEIPDEVPPLLLGVRGPRSLELTGAVADGVILAEPAHPTYITAALRHLAAGAPADGPAPQVVTYDVAAVAETDQAAWATVRPALAPIGEPDWRPHVAGLPFADDLAALRAASGSAQEFAARLPDEWVAELSLAGTSERVRAGIAARHRAGATSVVLTPTGPDRVAALDGLATALEARVGV
ncbi:LLM class flavin-dependent oxidoreductase [Georgenia thermotolerans]|uniref:LLM class flavin-dependent oxidoreductase n=1 Tax=Georgenia thermotolerans TaxID=527326 RepID=A0A7J5USD6_9MICO|nr:LLM class flavin-dependent oxidoreductase [Georgenia thermotolerans]KAE8765316.1 LLM class flavin-dependent oxidoreductase [Georgenia thermotolerans]